MSTKRCPECNSNNILYGPEAMCMVMIKCTNCKKGFVYDSGVWTDAPELTKDNSMLKEKSIQ